MPVFSANLFGLFYFQFQSTFCSDVMSASGESVASNDYCKDSAVGYMEVCEDGDYNYILASGAPDHEAEYDQDNPNPNTRCKFNSNH